MGSAARVGVWEGSGELVGATVGMGEGDSVTVAANGGSFGGEVGEGVGVGGSGAGPQAARIMVKKINPLSMVDRFMSILPLAWFYRCSLDGKIPGLPRCVPRMHLE